MAEKIKILIIDDDEVDRATVKRSLRSAEVDAETFMADSAAAGLKLIKEHTFDCLLIDFKLPDMDGLELLQEIRKINRIVPVLLVTSYGDERVAAEAIKMGASDYISKSLLTPESVSHSLRTAIRLARIEQAKSEAEENLKDTQNHLQTIIENTPIVLWGIDNEGIFNFTAGKGLEFVGIKGNGAIGRSVNEIFKNWPEVISNIKNALRGEINKASNAINGFVFETLYRRTYNAKREVIGLTGISFDITDRVKSEKALEKARDMAEESVRVKEQFFTNMSHEIRTPMNGIIGLSGVLQKTELNEEQRTYLDAIRTSSERLMVIINDLLDFSKIESGKISLEETNFNLRQLIVENIELLNPKAAEQQNRIKVIVDSEVPDEVAGDPVRLSQVLTNLIGNAIKFTEKGQVRILVENLQESPEDITLEFEIQDTGIGIPEDKLSTIFESFTQASNDTTRKYGGTGLGLTISRQLIEMQGGKLNVRSKPGEGSTFSFILTYKKAITENAAPKSEEILDIDPNELGALNILLAEDNEINQLLAKKVISDWGFNLDIAANGRIAVDMLKKKDYDVILMDMQMPEMDGYEATVYIRNEMGPKSNTPIIAFTAHATKTEIGRCMLAGANAYVSKPLKPNELLSEIYDLVMQEPGIGFIPEIKEEELSGKINSEDINIDLSFLKEMAQGNTTFMEEILTMFINSTPDNLAKMQELLDSQDWDTLKAIAHRLKSSMFLVGIKELEMNMATIEQLALNPEERHVIPGLLTRTSGICELAIEKLKPMLQIS
jgi:PAS domain S-box-containing protein